MSDQVISIQPNRGSEEQLLPSSSSHVRTPSAVQTALEADTMLGRGQGGWYALSSSHPFSVSHSSTTSATVVFPFPLISTCLKHRLPFSNHPVDKDTNFFFFPSSPSPSPYKTAKTNKMQVRKPWPTSSISNLDEDFADKKKNLLWESKFNSIGWFLNYIENLRFRFL